jgi:hypothetical protein
LNHTNIKRPFSFKGGTFSLAITFEIAIALVVTLTVLFLTWNRLFFGVDFTDEAFYIALPYRFALGDIPLKDEQNLAQLAGVLVMPFMRLFLYFKGSTESVVLFSRHLHFAFTVLVGLSVFVAIQRTLCWPLALMVSVICVVFVPFNIHGLSYNTMGSGFLTMGCFLGIANQDKGSALRWTYFFSGVCHCLAILVYPPLLVAVCIYTAIIFFADVYQREQGLSYVLGGGLAVTIPLILLLQAGTESLNPLIEYVKSAGVQGGGWGKLTDVIVNFWLQSPNVSAIVTSMAILGIWHCFKPGWTRVILPFLPILLVFYTLNANGTASLYFVIAVSLFGPFIYPFVSHDKFGRKLFRLIWWPSFVGGLVTAWSSSNGTVNASIGMFPATLASTLLIIRALQLMPGVSKSKHITQSVMTMATSALMIAPFLIGGYADVYGDPVPLSSLTKRVTTGPYRGINTTEAKSIFLDKFSRDLALLLEPNDTILFFSDFPAGYLFTSARPATNSVWLSSLGPKPTDLTSTFKYYKKNGTQPSLVFILKNLGEPNGLIVDMVNGNEYRRIFNGDSYSVFRRQQEIKS